MQGFGGKDYRYKRSIKFNMKPGFRRLRPMDHRMKKNTQGRLILGSKERKRKSDKYKNLSSYLSTDGTYQLCTMQLAIEVESQCRYDDLKNE